MFLARRKFGYRAQHRLRSFYAALVLSTGKLRFALLRMLDFIGWRAGGPKMRSHRSQRIQQAAFRRRPAVPRAGARPARWAAMLMAGVIPLLRSSLPVLRSSRLFSPAICRAPLATPILRIARPMRRWRYRWIN